MKKSYLLILFAVSLILTSAAYRSAATGHPRPDADYVFVPEGTIGDSITVPEFYISAIEVTNAQYREFINDLISGNDTTRLRLAMVDTLLWQRSDIYNEPYSHFYFQHRAYDLHPVVNVSKRGAELYCEWLTQKYNAGSKQKARFALPTEAQWTYAAKGGNPKAIYPWPGKTIEYGTKGKKKELLHCNYRVAMSASADSSKNNPDADITAAVRSYEPNTFGIYCMAGNVAEMLADRPYAKGGSWHSPADKVLISARENLDTDHGSPTLGFRPVMLRD